CTGGLGAEVKEHLVNVIFDLLTGKRKFPRRRPKKKQLFEKERIGQLVRQTQQREGLKKISSAVEQVAKDLRISPRQVWKCWKRFNVVRCAMRQEKIEHD